MSFVIGSAGFIGAQFVHRRVAHEETSITNDVLRLTGDPTALVAAVGALPSIDFRDTLRDMYRAMRSGA